MMNWMTVAMKQETDRSEAETPYFTLRPFKIAQTIYDSTQKVLDRHCTYFSRKGSKVKRFPGGMFAWSEGKTEVSRGNALPPKK